ncbi:MAG: urease accessory UreF family protein [Pseudomonadota bacterium]
MTDLLVVTQWLSPAFPLGSFAYSHGLETAISDGQVRDAGSLEAWLEVILTSGAGWNDALLLCAARRGEDVVELARAVAGSKERLEETEAQGAAFATTLAALGRQVPAAPLPVALGIAAQGLEVENFDLAALYLQNFMSNLVQCAVRFVPLGQSEGQGVLARLQPSITLTAARAIEADLAHLGSGTFMSDISAMRHEAQVARVYRT